jgi:hypothetical protein
MIGQGSKRALPMLMDALEARWLLAAPQLPGNAAAIVASQYQPSGYVTKVGAQLRNVALGGPISIDVLSPPFAGGGVGFAPYPVNTGLIALSQFNNQGFRTVGLQLDNVAVGGGLKVAGSDNQDASGGTSVFPITVTNSNLILNSQFNDGGFGILALQGNQLIPIHSRVGLQWRNVGVGGSVGVGLDNLVIQPSTAVIPAAVRAAASTTPVGGPQGQKIIDFTTNSGQITNSQFNDGGFGDIGFQWSNVGVGGNVATSSNTLFVNPLQNNTGPITVANRAFGANATAATPSASAAVATAQAATSSARPAAVSNTSAVPPGFETTYDNSATNSGQIVNSQFNDGGFGDIGLQWSDVHVKGTVSAVHNSLTVQPQNVGQGQITVQNVSFPAVAPTPPPPSGPVTPVPDDPAVVASDGTLTNPLPAPTGPISPFFPVPFSSPGTVTLGYPGNYLLENAATNSGLVQNGQFNGGGFGDQGLQWQKVEVGGNVHVVHNSLSVHPEGSKLAGITVSNVSYGAPISPKLKRSLADLHYLLVTPANNVSQYGRFRPAGATLTPPNDRILTNQQLAKTGGTDVVIQWNGIEHKRGLVVINNVIKIQGVGPMTGPIILNNIRFPFRVPISRHPKVTVTPQSAASPALAAASAQPGAASPAAVPASGVGIEPRNAALLNDANNSGIVNGAQINTGGFGDDGLQWNNVSVAGSVNVVHNQLSVDESSDLPPGDLPGPIVISNVSFNSGALDGGLSTKRDQIVTAPPRYFATASTHKASLGKPLPQDPNVRQDTTNSGILNGGQLVAGAANHALLQWQCVKVGGGVTVVDNVLTISVQDRPTGPIVISNVTFA